MSFERVGIPRIDVLGIPKYILNNITGGKMKIKSEVLVIGHGHTHTYMLIVIVVSA